MKMKSCKIEKVENGYTLRIDERHNGIYVYETLEKVFERIAKTFLRDLNEYDQEYKVIVKIEAEND